MILNGHMESRMAYNHLIVSLIGHARFISIVYKIIRKILNNEVTKNTRYA